MRFHDRLKELGFDSYAAYLASDLWADFKRRYREMGKSTSCAICNTVKHVQLHHTTYQRLGNEWFGDLTPLCRSHHVAVHDWLKENGKPVEATPTAIRRLRGVKVETLPQRHTERVVAKKSKKRKRRTKKEKRRLRAARAARRAKERLEKPTVVLALRKLVAAGLVSPESANRVIEYGDVTGMKYLIERIEKLTGRQRGRNRIP